MADLTVDPSQVQSITVDPSEVSATPAPAAANTPPQSPQAVDQPSQGSKLAASALLPFAQSANIGMGDIAAGVTHGVEGMGQMAKTIGTPPADATEKTVHALLGPGALAAYRMGKGMLSQAGDTVSQAKQVPAAIKDINQSPDPAGTYSRVEGKTLGDVGGQAITGAAAGEVLGVAGRAVSKAAAMRDIPAALSKDTVSTFNKVAANEGLPPVAATTARDAAAELSQNFISRAKATYKVVDDAVGGDLKPVQEKIRDLKTSIRINQNVNPELATKQTTQLAEQQDTLNGLVEKAKAAGVTDADKIMAAGDKDYSKGMEMKKVQRGVATASGQAKMGGHPNPGGFASQIDMLERKGVLQRAVGQEATDALVENAKTGLSRTRSLGAVKKAAGKVAGAAGIAAGGAVGYGVYKALSGK